MSNGEPAQDAILAANGFHQNGNTSNFSHSDPLLTCASCLASSRQCFLPRPRVLKNGQYKISHCTTCPTSTSCSVAGRTKSYKIRSNDGGTVVELMDAKRAKTNDGRSASVLTESSLDKNQEKWLNAAAGPSRYATSEMLGGQEESIDAVSTGFGDNAEVTVSRRGARTGDPGVIGPDSGFGLDNRKKREKSAVHMGVRFEGDGGGSGEETPVPKRTKSGHNNAIPDTPLTENPESPSRYLTVSDLLTLGPIPSTPHDVRAWKKHVPGPTHPSNNPSDIAPVEHINPRSFLSEIRDFARLMSKDIPVFAERLHDEVQRLTIDSQEAREAEKVAKDALLALRMEKDNDMAKAKVKEDQWELDRICLQETIGKQRNEMEEIRTQKDKAIEEGCEAQTKLRELEAAVANLVKRSGSN